MSENPAAPETPSTDAAVQAPAAQQAPQLPPVPVDERVKTALEGLGFKYKIDADNDYRLLFDLGNNRSQVAIIRSRTFDLGGIEMREIFSAGYQCKGPIPAKIAVKLLKQNMLVKVGAWGVVESSNKVSLAIFTAHVPADYAGKPLEETLNNIIFVADAAEQFLTKEKEDNF
jgi:hypothetical protein